MKSIKLVTLIILLPLSLSGQIDTEFWFAAPDITSEYGQAPKNGAPISLHFTALYATTVTVSRPADPSFVPIQISLQDLEHKSIELSAILPINQIETYPRALTDPTAYQDKGFKITAYPGEISCYYELDNKQNKDIFPLKGTNGLGTEFYVSTQNNFINGDYKGTAWSGFVIVATQDNTSITVELNDDLLHFIPHPATVTINLNSGQTYAFRALSTDPVRHTNGIRVTSDKNIAITVYDDAMQKERNVGGTSWDMFGDQIVPLNIVGTEYIVMKGFMVDAPEDGGERIFITATDDNTMIYIDNNPVPATTINKGQVYSYAIMNQATLVTSSKPVYVNHITGFEADLGGAILPPIGNCSGSYDVAFNRSPDPSESFYLNIMVRNVTTPGDPMRNQAAKNFTVVSNGVITPIPESYFTYILDSTYAVLKRDPQVIAFVTNCIEPGWAAMVRNPLTKFHLGIINGHINTGCKYGYFSDYKVIGVSAGIGGALSNTREVYCDLDPIRLVARGGMRYEWTCTSDPSVTSQISDVHLADPFFQPLVAGNYMFNVRITQDCGPEENIPLQIVVMYRPVANFDVEPQEGCSPLTATFTPDVDMSRVGKMIWFFDYPGISPSASQDTLSNPFSRTFPLNKSDTVVSYTIRLYTWAPFNACPDYIEKTVLVKPGVKADFTVSDSSGCHPLPVTFNNLSTGHLDNQSFTWDFGDNMESGDSIPVHTFSNYHENTVYRKVKLVVTSPLACKDSVEKTVEVFPFIQASLLVDSSGRCSPLTTRLNPVNTIGADTFYYSIRSPVFNQDLKRITNQTLVVSYRDTTYHNGPDTIRVNLTAMNREGCSDSTSTKKIIVYPEVKAKFDIDPLIICDASAITIANQSYGENISYLWDFGDGSSGFDTSLTTFEHIYYNLDDLSRVYDIVLEGINEYQCRSVYDSSIMVYPRVNAFFTVENTTNCSPVQAVINNFSNRASFYTWDFGDGTPQVYFSGASFPHEYINPLPDSDTSFMLSLNVISPEGCKDSMKRSINLLPHVIADFTMSDSTACSPANISFANISSGSNLIYNWKFGEFIKTNNIRWFEETFDNYDDNDLIINVVLTASNPQGCESSVSKQLVVYPFVDAIFGVDNLSGCSPLRIQTVDFSSPGAKFYSWDFGNGITSNAVEPSNTYINSSTDRQDHTIKLIVKNDHECYDTSTIPVSIFPSIRASFDADRINGCQPLSVSFTNKTNIISNTSFLWDFSNGRYSNLATPPQQILSNLSSSVRFFDITLKATSQYGCRDDTTTTIEVYPYIYAKFTVDRPGICSDEPFTIDRSGSTGAINHFFWDYDDDGDFNEDKINPVFSHTYPNTSDMDLQRTIRLVVTNAQGCDTSWAENITVHPQVRAAFTVNKDQICYPEPVTFTNLSGPAVPLGYYWDFGDGTTITNDNPQYTYRNFSHTDDETYLVSLTAFSEHGCDSTVSHPITVHAKPLADFRFPATVDCPPFTVTFTNHSLGTNLEYMWDLNDEQSYDVNPVHTFYNSGNDILSNTISLITQTDFGCSDTLTRSLNVYPSVQADFEASEWEGCNPLEISLDGNSTNKYSYFWAVDGEIFSNYEDPFYRFVNETGNDRTFNVQFRAVSINGCSDDTIKQITVFPKPLAEFLPSPQAQEFNTVTDITSVIMNNRTNNPESWKYSWDFGDGTSSSQSSKSFIKNYTTWGDINNNSRIPVSLIVSNNSHPSCSDTALHYVIIYPPEPLVDLGPDIAGCMPLTVEFSSWSKYINPESYEWDFGYNNFTSDVMNPEPVVYDSAGTYIVRLSVQGDGGTNWDYRLIHVYPQPVTEFDFTPDYAWLTSQTIKGDPIKFFNITDAANIYEWDFGDGNYSVEYQPIHEYTEEGTYYVTLTAENEHGCKSSFTNGPIIIDGQGILLFPNAITITPGNPADEYYNPDNRTDRRIFHPISKGVDRYKLEIYNRWGELIFTSHEVTRGWNGFIDGEPVKQDVYVWRVTATFTNGRPYSGAGDVTVLVKPL